MPPSSVRSWSRRAAFFLASVPALFGAACSLEDASSTSADDVTSVESTGVKSQAIANCWLYATAGWVESLHKGATARDVDVSEAYWNYWFWYEQISGGSITLNAATGISSKGTVSEGGWWGVGAELIRRYGYAMETDFIADADAKATRHTEAVAAINASLASGALREPAARRDPRIVRAELAKAWKLSAEVVAELERVFPVAAVAAAGAPSDAGDANDAGGDGGVALPAAPAAFVDLAVRGVPEKSSIIHAPQELPVLAADGVKNVTLADVVGTRVEGTALGDGLRAGPEAWTELRYTWNDDAEGQARRLALLKNLRHVLNRRLAVPIGWVTARGAKAGEYRAEMVTEATMGGLHESVLVDYEIDDVPGFGSLRVDERETRPEALEATLSDAANVRFFRIKNSWGTDPTWSEEEMRQYGLRPSADGGAAAKPNYLPQKPGFNDLYVDFLDTPSTKGNRVGGHMMLRLAMPATLRFAVPAPPAPPASPSDGGVEASPDSGASR